MCYVFKCKYVFVFKTVPWYMGAVEQGGRVMGVKKGRDIKVKNFKVDTSLGH